MATAKTNVKVTLDVRDPKKKVVKFSTDDEDSAIANIYLSNEADKKLGSPEEITLTITGG